MNIYKKSIKKRLSKNFEVIAFLFYKNLEIIITKNSNFGL